MADIPHPHGARPRPLSPHLQIYKWSVTMATSITHRVTGGALYIGLVFIAWWLVAASMGPETYEPFLAAAAHPIGQLILFGFTWAAAYHLINGIRHLAWDIGYGFLPKDAMWSGVVVIALSIIAAVGMFVWAYSVRMGGPIS
ncbi:MAG: succinate dehydrogenase, cytochrome b556 subunit [Rhizomicrobium sp.]